MKALKLLRKGMPSYAAQRVVTYWPLRKTAISLIAATRPSGRELAAGAETEALRNLETDGIHFLRGYLNSEAVARIRAHIEGHKVHERHAPFRKDLDLGDLPPHVHVADYKPEVVASCKDLVDAANDPKLLAIASAYLGCKPTISNMALWWSIPDDGSAQEAENYHRDCDDWKFVKFFIYLTDVDEGCGPHCFVRKSHRSTKLSRLRRLTDEEVTAHFPKTDQMRITGKAGDAFMEDTFGIHKGQPPLHGRRLLFALEYSINPVAVYKYNPLRVKDFHHDPYVNRLYLESA
jgi:hypothetical protein